ncbi:MAG: serine/threonine protein kinase [Gemmataceae bacterium]
MSIARIGKFSVVGELGRGANSTILHICRAEDGRRYALKIVPIESAEDKKFQEQAEHEYRIGQMLDHPNLIKIYALETQTDWLFRVKKVQLLIEYVPGPTLDRLKAMSVKKLLPIFVQVAAGLVHMHRRGVYHADMKPNNIILNERTGDAKIIDYGLAWVRGEKKDRIQGTPEYMAPETVTSSLINEKTDIFNFGATMYRLVTWRLPPVLLPQPGTVRINAKVHTQLLKSPAELNPLAPKALSDLILQCMQFGPDQRPERMSEIQGALDRLADELGPPAEGPDDFE